MLICLAESKPTEKAAHYADRTTRREGTTRRDRRSGQTVKILTGEIEEDIDPKKSAAAVKLGSRGGKARASRLTPEQRREIDRKAAIKRWQNRRKSVHLRIEETKLSREALRQAAKLTCTVVPNRDRLFGLPPRRKHLDGLIEIDESYYGGRGKPESRGRGLTDPNKSLMAIAVETVPASPRLGEGIKKSHFVAGSARIAVLPAATAADLGGFVRAAAKPGARIITDGLKSYDGLADSFRHYSIVQDGGKNADAGEC